MFQFFISFLLFFQILHANECDSKFDGSLKRSACLYYFLPHDAVILEIGAFEGKNTIHFATAYPKGHVIAFEPNPKSFNQLEKNVNIFKKETNLTNISTLNLAVNTYSGSSTLYLHPEIYFKLGMYCDYESFEQYRSLLKEKTVKPHFSDEIVPCVVLDEWCKQNGIDHVEMICLDAEGLELQILQSSPEILNTALVVHTKTNLYLFRENTSLFPHLRQYLEQSGFELVSHCNIEKWQGEATFIRKYVYDALFR